VALGQGAGERALADREASGTLEGQGVLLSWPTFGALTPTHRIGYQFAGR
jgi:hypothetical protein